MLNMILSQFSSPVLTICLLKIHLNVISSPPPESFKWLLLKRFSYQSFVCNSSLTYLSYISSPVAQISWSLWDLKDYHHVTMFTCTHHWILSWTIWPHILFPFRFILGCDCREDMDWILDLLTQYTHHSELQVWIITVLSLMSTIHWSPQHPLSFFPACCVFNSHSLATVSNSGDSLASCAHIISVQQISHNWTLTNCQLNYSALPSQPPLQSSTQPNYFTSLHFTSLHFTPLHSTPLHSTPLHSSGLSSSLCSSRGRGDQQKSLPLTVPVSLLWAVA
jgi:hypothetical protein